MILDSSGQRVRRGIATWLRDIALPRIFHCDAADEVGESGAARRIHEGGCLMLRRLAFGLLAAGLLLIAAPAFAQPPTNTTTHTNGLVETFVDVIPMCEDGGPLYTITTTSNSVMHETVFDDGRVHATFTQTGTFSAVPLSDPDLPSFTGTFTTWGGFNQNGTTVNGTSTFNLNGTGSDGSRLSIHQVEHFNVRPDGSANEFFHCH